MSNFLKFLLIFLAGVQSASGVLYNNDKAQLPFISILEDSSFYAGGGAWTASGLTATLNNGYVELVASASAQTYTSRAVTVPEYLKGANGIAYCSFTVASGTSTAEIQAYDGSNVLSEETIASTTTASVTAATFIFPTSGTIALRIYANADEPSTRVERCYLGLNHNVGQDAENVFSFKASSAGVVTGENVDWVTGDGAVSSTSRYTYTLKAGMFSAVPNCVCAPEDTGSTNSHQCSIDVAASSSTTLVIEADRCLADGTACTDVALNHNVMCQRSTDYQSTAFKSDTINWKLDLNYTGANPSLGTADQASYVAPNNSALSLVINTSKGSASAGISCSSTNDNTVGSTTCSAGNEELGFVANFPRAGLVEACMSFTHAVSNGATGSVSSIFQLIRTANGSQAVVEEGGPKVTSRNGIASSIIQIPHRLCGTFQIPSAAKHTIRLMYEQVTTATVTTNTILSDADTASGQREVNVVVRYIDQSTPAPKVKLSVVTSADAVYGFESAIVDGTVSPSTVTENGDWIDGNCTRSATGDYTCPIKAGIFSATPICVANASAGSPGGNWCRSVGVSNISVDIGCATANTTPSATNGTFNLFCMGPR